MKHGYLLVLLFFSRSLKQWLLYTNSPKSKHTKSFRFFLNQSDLYKPNPNHSSSANSASSLRLTSPGYIEFLETKQFLGKALQPPWKEHWIRRRLLSVFHSQASELYNLVSGHASVSPSTQHKLIIISFSEAL